MHRKVWATAAGNKSGYKGGGGVVDAAAVPAEARALLEVRAAARAAKDWPAADRARGRLASEFGLRVEDQPDGTSVFVAAPKK